MNFCSQKGKFNKKYLNFLSISLNSLCNEFLIDIAITNQNDLLSKFYQKIEM